MKRIAALKVVNVFLGILALNQIVTGLLSESISPQMFEVLHEGGGILFAILAMIHLVLNWGWVRLNYFRSSPARTSPRE